MDFERDTNELKEKPPQRIILQDIENRDRLGGEILSLVPSAHSGSIGNALCRVDTEWEQRCLPYSRPAG